jgi:hypothetical protein
LLPLAPLYVSTVDSGNFLGYLITLKMTLPAMIAGRPQIDRRFQNGLADTLDLLERSATPAMAQRGREGLRALRAELARIRARFAETPQTPTEWEWLGGVSEHLAKVAQLCVPEPVAPTRGWHPPHR